MLLEVFFERPGVVEAAIAKVAHKLALLRMGQHVTQQQLVRREGFLADHARRPENQEITYFPRVSVLHKTRIFRVLNS